MVRPRRPFLFLRLRPSLWPRLWLGSGSPSVGFCFFSFSPFGPSFHVCFCLFRFSVFRCFCVSFGTSASSFSLPFSPFRFFFCFFFFYLLFLMFLPFIIFSLRLLFIPFLCLPFSSSSIFCLSWISLSPLYLSFFFFTYPSYYYFSFFFSFFLIPYLLVFWFYAFVFFFTLASSFSGISSSFS